jgi:tol-pal system protein YbgF
MSLGFLGFSGCVQPQQVEVLEREQRQIKSETAALRASLADERANWQQLQREFSNLKERIEENRYQVDQSSRQGDQRVKNLEATVTKLTEGLKTQGEQLKERDDELRELRKGVQQHAVLPPDSAEMSSAENDIVRREYEVAWRILEKRDYRLAIARFKDFLKKFPKSRLAGNAQYWIGEGHFALREFDQAVIEFDAVRSRYPEAEKIPAALLKQGLAFAELGENRNARLILQEILEKHGQTPEAGQAKQKLKALES